MALAFDGIRIVDFTQVLAGPFATYQLALLGAEVIKVESVHGGDIARPMLDPTDYGGGEFSPIFLGVNHNKRSIAVDLKRPEGREAIEALTRTADVLVQNFRPGVIERLGFGYEAVKEMNPGIVYCAVSGYGSKGPRAASAAFDGAIQAASGLMASNGHASTGPTRTGSPIVDISTGMIAAFAIASALLRRERTGEGQLLDVSMLDSAVTLLNPVYNVLLATGAEPELLGNMSLTRMPTADVFPTEDGWVQITVITQPHVAKLFEALGIAERLEDPRFSSEDAQIENAETLTDEIATILRTAPTAAWLERLREAGLPCAPVASLPEVLADPQLEHRALTATLPPPPGLAVEKVSSITTGYVADRDGPRARSTAPKLGADTAAVLAELGYAPDRIQALRETGAIA